MKLDHQTGKLLALRFTKPELPGATQRFGLSLRNRGQGKYRTQHASLETHRTGLYMIICISYISCLISSIFIVVGPCLDIFVRVPLH